MVDEKIIRTESPTLPSDYEIERNKPMPSLNHGAIQANLIFLVKLNNSTSKQDKKYRTVSELNLELSDWGSVPDIALIPWEKLDTKNDIIRIMKPPLCVMEILSPKQSLNELLIKANNYFKNGVKSCWIVLPGVDNIYVFSTPDDYEIFKSGETLLDKKLAIQIEVAKVFE